MTSTYDVRRFFLLIGLAILSISFIAAQPVAAQDEEADEGSRQIFAAEFLNARPGAKSRPTPKVTKGPAPLAPDLLGITMWRLRPAKANDDTQTRLLDHDGSSEALLVAERIPSETKFKEGQKVRISIESPRTGYLYVIDREQYSDGTFSEPYLIFPTLKIRDGDNAVTAGRLIEIPDQDDNPIYFKMKRSRDDQVAEVLTILVTSKPIENLALGRKPLKLTTEQYAQWEQSWKAPTKRVETAHHPSSTYTRAEKTAGSNRASLLGQNDPPPQTIYRVSSKPGDPIMITLALRYEPLP